MVFGKRNLVGVKVANFNKVFNSRTLEINDPTKLRKTRRGRKLREGTTPPRSYSLFLFGSLPRTPTRATSDFTFTQMPHSCFARTRHFNRFSLFPLNQSSLSIYYHFQISSVLVIYISSWSNEKRRLFPTRGGRRGWYPEPDV